MGEVDSHGQCHTLYEQSCTHRSPECTEGPFLLLATVLCSMRSAKHTIRWKGNAEFVVSNFAC